MIRIITLLSYMATMICAFVLSGWLIFSIAGCGGDAFDIKELPKEVPGNDPAPPPAPDPGPTNPTCSSIMPFDSVSKGGFGSLWKPEGDHTGKPVFLIDNDFRRVFDSCKVRLKDGVMSSLSFTGFSNGDRQTWRVGFPCEDVAGKKAGGFIRCKEATQECRWDLPGGPCQRHW